jgi:hypothetical protein
MNKQLTSITFFTIALLAFGFSALNFDNPAILENKKAYIAIAGGVALAAIYIRSRRKEK